jgi:hypothetical protein
MKDGQSKEVKIGTLISDELLVDRLIEFVDDFVTGISLFGDFVLEDAEFDELYQWGILL